MDIFSLTDDDITQRKEIVELLKIALAKKWPFSYITNAGKRVTTNPLIMTAVNADEGSITVHCETMDKESISNGPTMFRAQYGGLSILFQSRVVEDTAAGSSVHQFEIPYKVSCTQLRKAVRVNLETLPDVPVVLYQVNGTIIEGKLMDVSTSGSRIRVAEDMGVVSRNPHLVDACKVTFSDSLELQLGIQIVDVIEDKANNTSFLRCEFSHLSGPDQEQLDNFIQETLLKFNAAQSD